MRIGRVCERLAHELIMPSCFVVRYSGEVGRQLARLLHECGAFERIVLVGRRRIEDNPDFQHPNMACVQ